MGNRVSEGAHAGISERKLVAADRTNTSCPALLLVFVSSSMAISRKTCNTVKYFF